MTTARRNAIKVGAPLVVGIAFLTLWELFVIVRSIPPFVLPKPTDIWAQMQRFFADIWSSFLYSGSNALAGLVIGSVLGVALAVFASRLPFFERLLSPMAAAVAAMPIVALAPIFNTMFTSTSTTPRRLIVIIVVFFPMFINTVRGLRQVDPIHNELMSSYAATSWQTMRAVRFPGSLPFICSGLRIASSLAVISAVVAEYFGGTQNGLGSRITSAAANTAYARAWGYVVASIVLGLLFYLGALLFERVAMPWKESAAL
jgi:NitT/TauT family transport system permease protein